MPSSSRARDCLHHVRLAPHFLSALFVANLYRMIPGMALHKKHRVFKGWRLYHHAAYHKALRLSIIHIFRRGVPCRMYEVYVLGLPRHRENSQLDPNSA